MSQITPVSHPFLLFDLDGTLTESGPGITDSLQWTFRQMGMEPEKPENLRRYIGPPLADSLRDFRGMKDNAIVRFITLYRSRYETIGVLKSDPYPGIPALLDRLKKAGYILLTATSKLQSVAEDVLTRYKLSSYFTHIGGGDFVLGQDKASVICRSLSAVGATPHRSLMIGDRKYDILGAKANGLPSIGAVYGYGSRQELLDAGADYLAESVQSLGALLL